MILSRSKHIIQILICFIVFSCETADDSPSYQIFGNIKNLENTTIYLANLDMNTNKRVYIDSTKSDNGRFTFNGTVESPYAYAIFLGDDKQRIDFFLENSTIQITGNNNELQNIEVTGSREDSLFRPWFNHGPFENRKNDLNIILNHPDYHLSAFIAFYHFQVFETPIDSIEMIISSFDQSLHQSLYYVHLLKLYESLSTVKIGEKAPDFTMPDLSGKRFSLSDFKGRYVFLDFWAEWCSPCRKTNKELIKIYPTLNKDSIEFISISLDETREAWERAVDEDQLTWIQLSDLKGWETEIANIYGIRAIPQSFLIAPNGFIIGKNIDYKALNRFKRD
jgi:peroxiredoxin